MNNNIEDVNLNPPSVNYQPQLHYEPPSFSSARKFCGCFHATPPTIIFLGLLFLVLGGLFATFYFKVIAATRIDIGSEGQYLPITLNKNITIHGVANSSIYWYRWELIENKYIYTAGKIPIVTICNATIVDTSSTAPVDFYIIVGEKEPNISKSVMYSDQALNGCIAISVQKLDSCDVTSLYIGAKTSVSLANPTDWSLSLSYHESYNCRETNIAEGVFYTALVCIAVPAIFFGMLFIIGLYKYAMHKGEIEYDRLQPEELQLREY